MNSARKNQTGLNVTSGSKMLKIGNFSPQKEARQMTTKSSIMSSQPRAGNKKGNMLDGQSMNIIGGEAFIRDTL